jgi:TrkA domain protein
MINIQETVLPGVGLRFDFVTRSGERVGVISHHGGWRDLLIYNRNDPDACATSVRLEEDETRTLAEILGGSGSSVMKELTDLQQQVEGLAIDWVPISTSWGREGQTIKDAGLALMKETGVSIVAVVRQGNMIPSPTPDFVLMAGDVVVVVGTVQAIKDTATLLQVGECP